MRADETDLVELRAALAGLGLDLVVGQDGDFASVVQRLTGRRWLLAATPPQVREVIRKNEADGRAAGVGNPSANVSAGAALLALHIDEAVSTAATSTTRLMFSHRGMESE